MLGPDTFVYPLKSLSNTISCSRKLQKGIQSLIYYQSNDAHSERHKHELLVQDLLNEDESVLELPAEGVNKLMNKAESMIANLTVFKEHNMKIDQLLAKSFQPNMLEYCLLIDAVSFRTAISDLNCKRMLLGLFLAAETVFCCNFLPRDKSQATKLMKESFVFKPVVLAVGDGNNDIPMLQEAHIGVGIESKASFQAKFYSEIVISHFADLRELLLLHGHWNYSRMSRVVLLFLYKNFILIFVTFIFLFLSDYSGAVAYDFMLLFGYNVLFTTLPVIVMGVFDEDVTPRKVYRTPEVYSTGIYREKFSVKHLLKYTALAVVHALVLSLILWGSTSVGINDDGFTVNSELYGTCLFTGVVVTVLLQIAVETHCFSNLFVTSVLLSIAVFLLSLWVASNYDTVNDNLLGVTRQLASSPMLLLTVSLAPLVCFIISYSIQAYSVLFRQVRATHVFSVLSTRINNVRKRIEQYANGLIFVLRVHAIEGRDHTEGKYDLYKYSLLFKSFDVEKEYRVEYIEKNILFYRLMLIFFWFLLVLWTFFEAVLLEADLIFTLIRSLLCVGFTAILFLFFTEHYKNYYVVYNIMVITVGVVSKYALYISFARIGSLAAGLIPALTYILFNVDFLKITLCNLLSLVLFLVELISHVLNSEEVFSLHEGLTFIFSNLLLNTAITVTSAYIGYILEHSRRNEYKLINQTKSSLETTKTILSILLPEFVKERVQSGETYIAEDVGEVTVIFCDICDFDSICAEYNVDEFTFFLDSLFQIFDRLCDSAGVVKIETVGKTYMACAGLRDFEAGIDEDIRKISQARRAVEFALSTLMHVRGVQLKNEQPLQVKIGINSGRVTAGVVGYHKPQFSLVGDTVNTASRMCSTLLKYNAIQISSSTFQMLEDRTGLDLEQTQVEAKGKGLLTTYIVKENPDSTRHEILSHQRIANINSSYTRKESVNEEGEEHSFAKGSTNIENEKNKEPEKNEHAVAKIEGLLTKIDFFTLSCKENRVQKEFRVKRIENNAKVIKLSLYTAIMCYLILSMLSFYEFFLLDDLSSEIILLARVICIFVFIGILALFRVTYRKKYFSYATLFILNIPLYTALSYIIISTERWNDLIALEIMYVILLLAYCTGASVILVFRGSFFIFIPWLVLAFYNDSVTAHATNSLFVVGFSIINISAVYSREIQLREQDDLQRNAETEIKRTNKLLSQMMPRHVVDNMREGKGTSDKFLDVTLLYADIVGFTNWSSGKTPTEVVEMLSEMFTDFDKNCTLLNVYKVHTIGDCYVILGLVENSNRDCAQECMNVLEMGFKMLEIIDQVNKERESELNMRIGIHTGEVIAGIIGTSIVRYDIYGPDVLIANKMESGGESGKINVSDVTRNIIETSFPGEFTFTNNKPIEAKSINRKHDSYFINRNS